MGNYQLLVFTNPAEGRDDDFHDWYENTHLDDVLRTAGFVRSAQRWSVDVQVGLPMPNTHLAIYEAEGDSAQEVFDRLNATRGERDMSGADVMDQSAAAFYVVGELGPRHEA